MAERLNYQCKFEKYKEELIRLRRHFHRHPELGLQEFETSAFIQEYLGKLGYRFRIVEPTGIIAEHPCQDEAAFAGKKKVVLRAEMDALPIQEQTGLSYASENAGVMHACGHDGIVASALVLARILAEEGERSCAMSFPSATFITWKLNASNFLSIGYGEHTSSTLPSI